jgi:hypothetical protein
VGELPKQTSIKYTRNIHKMVLSITSIIKLIQVSLSISNKRNKQVYSVPGLEVNTDRFGIRKIPRLLKICIAINKEK